jgi:Holliday junction resolvase RusA-like endonuclease
MATLILHGHLPSKKNLWKRGRGGRTYIDSDVKALIDALTAQAQHQWKDEPVEHPELIVEFYMRDKRRDRDNMLTTVLDCLCAAGVLVNDNVARCNGLLVVYPAVIDKDERVTIEVTA